MKTLLDKQVINTLEQWERIAFDHEPAFLERFCSGDAWQLINVSWSANHMKIGYIVDSGQHIGDSVAITEWLDFLDDKQ
jgi:hypothetical protein